MREIILIRHGQSTNNAGPDRERTSDPNLTETGRIQAQALAAWATGQPITHLYCSPFARSLQTAEPLASKLDVCPHVIVNLCEQGGPYEGHDGTEKVGVAGRSREEIASAYPDWKLEAAITGRGWWCKPYETHEKAVARARSIASWMLELDAGVHAFVIHADFKQRLLEATLPGFEALFEQIGPLRNTGVSHLTVGDDGRFVLHSLNVTSHLDRSLVT